MKQYNLSPYLLEGICAALGRPVSPSEQGDRNSFVDFTEQDVADFRLLGKDLLIFSVAYIRFRLNGGGTLNTVLDYFSLVVQQGMPVEEWIASENM